MPFRRLPPVAVIVVAAAAALPAPAVAACDGAGAQPGQAATAAAEAATVCLLNEQRAQQGLGPLGTHDDLAAAARGHAQDMVARAYFAHDAPDGTTLLDRLRAAGWLPASGDWTAGENIAWGSGRLGSPAEIVTAWMNSAGHRANILKGDFDEVGLGVVLGAPGTGTPGAATFVADFGSRERDPAPAAGDDGLGDPLSGYVPVVPSIKTPPSATTRHARCTRAARRRHGRAARRAALRRCAAAARRARR